MNSLKDVFNSMVQQDHVKVAQARAARQGRQTVDLSNADQDIIKQAQDYDYIGRVLAHHAFADMVKEALDEDMAGLSEEEKAKELAKILAQANGEKPEGEEKKEEEKKEGEGEGEKKAHVKRAILQKMANDPEYASYLIAKYLNG